MTVSYKLEVICTTCGHPRRFHRNTDGCGCTHELTDYDRSRIRCGCYFFVPVSESHRAERGVSMTRTGQLEMQMGLDAGIKRAGEVWVTQALVTMHHLGEWRGTFTADDLVAAIGMPPGESHSALGAIFKKANSEGWIKPTGRYVKSTRPEAHGRVIAVWKSAS